jgi:hypothetical protein
MSGVAATSRSSPGLRVKRSPGVTRLLRSNLSPKLFGERVPLDFYARNGFRLLRVPAWLDAKTLAVRSQQFQGKVKLDPMRARDEAIRTISDEHLDMDALALAVSRLDNPRHRMFAELFWPHVGEPEFERIRKVGAVGCAEAVQIFNPNGHRGLAHAQKIHALAVAHHCLAIETEFDFLEGRCDPAEEHWRDAIRWWRELCKQEEFWRYMASRAEKMDDPRLKKEDVAAARAELPRVILAPQEILVEKYAEGENYEACVRHLDLIANSGFPEEVIREATWHAVKRVAGSKLEELSGRARESIQKITGNLERNKLEAILGPLLAEALSIRDLLADRLRLSPALLEQPAFDSFAEMLLQAANDKAAFESDERERNLLYRAEFAKRLMRLPLTAPVRRTMEQAMREVDGLLYSHLDISGALPQAIDCFFLAGADATPDDSIIVPMYRITKREVFVNRPARTGGVNVEWMKIRLLVPRSKEARPAHGRTVRIELDPAQYTPEQRAAAAQIKELETAHRRAQADLKNQCDRETRAAEEAGAAAVERAVGERAREAAAAMARLAAEEESALAEEDRALEARKQQIDIEHEPALKAANGRQAEIQRAFGGIRGFAKIELAPMVVLYVLLRLLTDSDVLAAAGGIGLSLVAGRLFRSLAVSMPREKALRAHRRAIEEAAAESARQSSAIREKFAGLRKQPEAEAAKAAKEKSRLEAASQNEIAAIRKRWDQRLASAEAEYEKKVRPYKAKLMREGQVKPESKKTEFPAYVAACAKGYKPGTEPSQYEMQMTPNEELQARLMLGIF